MQCTWLLGKCAHALGDAQRAFPLIHSIVAIEPWHVPYLSYEIILLQELNRTTDTPAEIDPTLAALAGISEHALDWDSFQAETAAAIRNNQAEISYLRCKVYFLYHPGDDAAFKQLLAQGAAYNHSEVVAELLRLLNSPFDRPQLTLGLARLAKDQWQLETASMWYEQLLRRSNLPSTLSNEVYTELADCYLWRNCSLAKVQQLVQLFPGLNPGGTLHPQQQLVLIHLYLRQGMLHEAKQLLEQVTPGSDIFEVHYLWGCYWLQTGLHSKAKAAWKPLIKTRCETLRQHHLKEKMFAAYFPEKQAEAL